MNKKIYILFVIYKNGKQMLRRGISSTIPADFAKLNTLVNILVHYLKALLSETLNNHGDIQIGNFYATATCNGVINDLIDINGVIPNNIADIEDLLEQSKAHDSLLRIVTDYALAHSSKN